MAKVSKSEKVPKSMQATFDAIVGLTDAFCQERLNAEYMQLSRQATAALCRKRPSPLQQGRLNTWACGIVYALGSVNFLFDRSQTPYLPGADLCEAFGISKSTGAAKAKAVRDALPTFHMDPNWTLPSRLADNPMVWMVQVNGLIVDARNLPLAFQEILYQKGLITYIPGKDRG
jgi:hypothetical protein